MVVFSSSLQMDSPAVGLTTLGFVILMTCKSVNVSCYRPLVIPLVIPHLPQLYEFFSWFHILELFLSAVKIVVRMAVHNGSAVGVPVLVILMILDRPIQLKRGLLILTSESKCSSEFSLARRITRSSKAWSCLLSHSFL